MFLQMCIKFRLPKSFWEKLKVTYQTKSMSNRLYLKEQFSLLQIKAITKVSDHLGVLNDIVSKPEVIGVKIRHSNLSDHFLLLMDT